MELNSNNISNISINFLSKENDKLMNGLYIDKEAFKTMSKLADQVLVASNEQSRQGAGE